MQDENTPKPQTKCVQSLLNRHRLLFLPLYSPDLNPTGNESAQAKFIRQGWIEIDLPKLFHDDIASLV